MGNPWKDHGKLMGKNPWIPLKTLEHGAGAKFHDFHGDISMLSMLALGQENCKIILHENMGSTGYKTMEKHGKHGNLQK